MTTEHNSNTAGGSYTIDADGKRILVDPPTSPPKGKSAAAPAAIVEKTPEPRVETHRARTVKPAKE